MKAVYETPRVNFEQFETSNSIAAACSFENTTSVKWQFYCLVGDTVDAITGIIASFIDNGCGSKNVGWSGDDGYIGNMAGVDSYYSNNDPTKQSTSDVKIEAYGNGMKATANGSNPNGFLYYCTTGGKNGSTWEADPDDWAVNDDGVWVHQNATSCQHVHIMPVYGGVQSVNRS